MERWADIDERYQVSTYGRVASKDIVVRQKSRGGNYFQRLVPGKMLKCCVLKTGYLQACLKGANGEKIKRNVHRLVGEAFLPNPEGKPQINHIDGNKLNNAVSNLEWATAAENSNHAKDVLGVWPDNRKAVKRLSDGMSFDSLHEAAAYCNRAVGNLSSHLKGKQETFAGDRWVYVEKA